MKRRSFLGWAGALGTTVVVGRYFAGRAHAAPFGEAPPGSESAMLPPERRVRRVLEVFLYGGLSPWETLYFVPGYGTPTDPLYPRSQYYAFDDDTPDGIRAASRRCGIADGTPMSLPFARDALDVQVELGPFARRLWDRPEVLARTRLVVQQHRLEPHEAAVPQALTGRPVGQPAAAGLGTHVQRFFADRDVANRASPWSYVFATGGVSADNVSAAAASGAHPATARPLLVKVDNAETFVRQLERATVRDAGGAGGALAYDELLKTYTDDYGRRLSWPEQGPVRSRRYSDLAAASGTVARHQALQGVLTPDLFDARAGQACGRSRTFDVPGVSLEAARHLLTHPTEPARYVCVSDIGLYEASGGGGYDSHEDNSIDQSRNFDNLLRSLLGIIDPTGQDPTKLSLADTLVVLNTEFGRTPWPQEEGNGRNHHPYGYVTAFLGGTIASAGVHGAIGPDGNARPGAATPAENRIAALLALGIWPFSPEAFAVSDVPGATGELEAARLVTERVLGVTL